MTTQELIDTIAELNPEALLADTARPASVDCSAF